MEPLAEVALAERAFGDEAFLVASFQVVNLEEAFVVVVASHFDPSPVDELAALSYVVVVARPILVDMLDGSSCWMRDHVLVL